MSTKSFGPLLEVARIQSEINRLFDSLLDLDAGEQNASSWVPNADIVETDDTLVLQVELPGVAAADLSLSVLSGTLRIEGKKPRESVPESSEFQVVERSFGPFTRSISLGVPVNTRRAEAVLKNGLLRICFPKVPNRRGESVTIEVTQG